MLAVAAGIFKGEGGDAQGKVVQHLRQGRGLHSGGAAVIAAAAVPQQEHHLAVFLRSRQSPDGKRTFHADAHQLRQIGHWQGGEKVAVDRGFLKGGQKGGLGGGGAAPGRSQYLPQQGFDRDEILIGSGEGDAAVPAVFSSDGCPHRGGETVGEVDVGRIAAGGGGESLPVAAAGGGPQLEKLGPGKEKQGRQGQQGDGDVLNEVPAAHGGSLLS